MTSISPLPPKSAQQTRHGIVNMGEQKSEDKECTVLEAGHKDLIGDAGSTDQSERKESRKALTSKAGWKNIVKSFKLRFLISASVSKPSMAIMDKSEGGRENDRGKHIGWVQRFGNLFQHPSKKQCYQGGSEMSTFQRNYLLIKDGITPRTSNSPSSILPFTFHKKISKAAQTIRQQCQLSLKLGKSRKSVTGVSKESGDKPLCKTFMDGGSEQGSEKLNIPLLEYSTAGSSSANASSSLSEYDPVTLHKLPPPWILRKWKLRGSQKLLRIDPAKELLFQLTRDADRPQDKHYTCTIKMENRTSRFVAFKFKCTCPQGYMMRPKHGILAPNATLEVKGLRIGDPLYSSTSKRDLFVIITLPIPAGVMKQTTETVSASIFDRFQGQCYCEGVFQAVYRHITDSNRQRKVDAVLGSNISLTSIPEEYDLEH